MNNLLTPRWTKLKPHAEQLRLWNSPCRFRIAHAGRRAGKTELAKRFGVLLALDFEKPQGRFVFSAPTHAQAVNIFWDDLLALIPRWALMNGLKSISTSYRKIKLYNGATIEVAGMDRPERIEGPPLDFFIGDEFGNFKSTVWGANIRPALSTLGRPGGSWLVGVPEGRNHYFQLAEDAADLDDWDVFTWHTSEINPEEAEKARGGLDEILYSQEYQGEFVSFKGRAYYAFDKELNCPPEGERILYNPNFPLNLCFDFNRVPGSCTIAQELPPPDWLLKRNQGSNRGLVSCAIDEIFFQQDSNTEKLCAKILQRWGQHRGEVNLYGDATGGAKKSSATRGSDWDIINEMLSPKWALNKRYPKANPLVRVRLNSTNSRMVACDGYIGTIVDRKCKFLIRDFEGVTCDEEGAIQKSDIKSLLTHISDGFGYYIHREYPFGGGECFVGEF